MPEIAVNFEGFAEFDPAGDFEAFLAKIPARWVTYLVSDADGGNNAQTDCCNHQHQGQSIQCQRVIGEPFFGRHIFIFGASLIVAWAIIIGWAVRA